MVSLSDITFGQYLPTGSVVHRLDPRTKLLVVFGLMVMIFVLKSPSFYLLLALLLVIAAALSRLPAHLILRNLRAFLWLFLITFGIHLFTTQGGSIPPFPMWKVDITYEGLENGLFFSCRLALLILMATLLMLTTSPMELTDGIERSLSPFKRLGLPVHELAMMMVIALRFIPVLIEEADRLRKAQLARGASFRGNLIKRAKSLIPLLVPLFLSAFRRADELALAMEARCYRGGEGRTSFNQLRLNWRDYLAICVAGIVGFGGLLAR